MHLRAQAISIALCDQVREKPKCDTKVIEALLAIAEQPVVVLSESGSIVHANPAFQNLTGIDNPTGGSFQDLATPLNAPLFVEHNWLSLRPGARWEGGFWLRHSDKENATLTRATCFALPRTYVGGDCPSVVVAFGQSAYGEDFAASALDVLSNTGSSAAQRGLKALEDLATLVHLAQQSSQTVGFVELLIEHPARTSNLAKTNMQEQVGAQLLERLTACGRPEDRVIAVSPSLYVVAIVGVSSDTELELIAHRLVREVHRTLQVDKQTLILTACAGVALYPLDGGNVCELLKRTSLALKHARKPQYQSPGVVRFSAVHHDHAEMCALVEQELRAALLDGSVQLHYQAIVDMRTGIKVGAEALLRWRHPIHGDIGPTAFLPRAEEMGLMTEIGVWTMREAFQFASALAPQSSPSFTVSVNVSATSIPNGIPAETVASLLAEAECEPRRIGLELTETTLVQQSDVTTAWFNAIADQGIRIDIDDFGVGYSALAYISEYPIRRLKIDRALVHGLNQGRANQGIVKALIDMADALDMQIVAEGVESQEQAEMLHAMGCRYAQGFLFGYPMPAQAFLQSLNETGGAMNSGSTL